MNILFPATECEPFAKAGGLGDVTSALPAEIIKHNIDIRVIIPYYQKVELFFEDNPQYKVKIILEDLEVSFEKYYQGMKKVYSFNVLESRLISNPDVIIYFIDIPEFFFRENLYVDENGKGFPDSAEIFAYFSKAIFDFLAVLDWSPDIIHCNDWHSGIIPLFLKHNIVQLKKPSKTIFSIHNIAYQGSFPLMVAEKLGLSTNVSLMDDLGQGTKINFLKAGITSADVVTTVSRTYRDELLSSEFGNGLESYLENKKENFFGILNGVDYEAWNPNKDKLIEAQYSPDDLSGKKICKNALWKVIKENNQNFITMDEKTPIIGMVSRIDRQKGFDIIIEDLPEVLKENVCVIIVGSGNKKFEEQLIEFNKNPKFTFLKRFSNPLSHVVEAGSDFFLMPSKFEPCGLNQMYSLRYGTLPIVRKTGGLADTVKDLDKNPDGNGFVFSEYSGLELLKTIKRALNYYSSVSDKELDDLRSKIMKQNFSWEESVKKYVELYSNLLI